MFSAVAALCLVVAPLVPPSPAVSEPAPALADSARLTTPSSADSASRAARARADSASAAARAGRSDAESAAADTTPPPRIVRQFEPIVVEGGRRSDPGSIETVYSMPAKQLRSLPVDRLLDAVALQAGVVAVGEDLHVRGGRTGELSVSTLGIPLNEPLWGRPMELPLLAVRSAELLEGALDADHRGSLAGEMDVQTEVPTARPTGMARWITDGRRYGSYDAGLSRLTGPLGAGGLGFALAGEVRLDDHGLPPALTFSRQNWFGAKLGWRQDNHLLAWAKLAPIAQPQRASVEVFASRVVSAPYNPMFAFDGWVTPTNATPDSFPYLLSDKPINSSSIRYQAAHHYPMTEERRIAILATQALGGVKWPTHVTLGWLRSSTLTSIDLRRDPTYTRDAYHLVWGPYGRSDADPFHAYLGDTPYFVDGDGQRWLGRADVTTAPGVKQRLKFGGGLTYDQVRATEIDDAPNVLAVDSLRSYHAFAPGGFVYAQHRWETAGLIWNAGMRVQAFTAGPQAPRAHTIWNWSPRLGFAYPVSTKDAFSVSYSRIHQDPDRDLLYENRNVAYNSHPLGNGELTPAEMISYQAAVKHILDPSWSIQIAVFYRDVYGQPGPRNRPTNPRVFRLQYDSVEDGHASGAEFATRWEWPGGQRLEASYTYSEAWGTQSNPDGLAFGVPRGFVLLPRGTHALDWDQRHSFAVVAQLHWASVLTLGWSTRLGSGLPWTPIERTPGLRPPTDIDQTALNTGRLPWNESTDLTLRCGSKYLFGLRAILGVTNLFDNRAPRRVTLPGNPNPIINTLEDDYTTFYTETGLGGGAYYDNGSGIGSPGWIRVHDPRLDTRPRSFRLGFEVGR